MSATELDYKGKKAKINVAKNGATYAGTILITGFDPPIHDVGADSSSEEGALTNAQHRAKELIDQKLG